MSIKVQAVSKIYDSQIAVNNISFSVEKGEVVGFLGVNGAGKSTTLKMITGYLAPNEGDIEVCDLPVTTTSLAAKAKIGYLPEHNPLYKEMYVKEYLTFIANVHKVAKERIQEVVQVTGLTLEVHKKIQQLSKGYQQRVGLAAALIHNPEVLILDEPTTGLDPNQLIEIRQLIKELGKEKTILFSTHIMQEVEAICDRVIIINKGAIVVDAILKDLLKGAQTSLYVEFDAKINQTLFENLSDILEVTSADGNAWVLTFNSDVDKRSAVFDFAKQFDLKILQLNAINKNLEKLFREATQQ